ncbi:MAG: DUF4124 domain-containing protein [Zoogloeaceae bacterium]|nr:DUF4124 domain-containing protein [Zoogloeaceae bacterium]
MIRRLAALGLLLFALNAQGQGSLYKWVDEKGVVHYSDTPPSGKAGESSRPGRSRPSTALRHRSAAAAGRNSCRTRTSTASGKRSGNRKNSKGPGKPRRNASAHAMPSIR